MRLDEQFGGGGNAPDLGQNCGQSPAGDEIPKQETKHEELNIKLTDQSDNEIWFKVRPTTKLKNMCTAWCERNGKALDSVRFMFEGDRIVFEDDPTPAKLGIKNEENINVFTEQRGGATQSSEQEQEHDASPSPPPKPPTAMTPGPRAAAFLTFYDKTLSHTVKSVTYDSFADCFPSIAANAPETLKFMHSNMQEQLKLRNKNQFETLVQERNVIANLNSLEDLINDAKRRKARSTDDSPPPTAPHLLPAPVVASAHLASLYASQQSQLNAKLQTVQSQNATLATKIQAQQQEIEQLVKSIEARVEDVDKTLDALAPKVDGLAKEARKAESEMMDIE